MDLPKTLLPIKSKRFTCMRQSMSVCLSVCLPDWLAGWLHGWLPDYPNWNQLSSLQKCKARKPLMFSICLFCKMMAMFPSTRDQVNHVSVWLMISHIWYCRIVAFDLMNLLSMAVYSGDAKTLFRSRPNIHATFTWKIAIICIVVFKSNWQNRIFSEIYVGVTHP